MSEDPAAERMKVRTPSSLLLFLRDHVERRASRGEGHSNSPQDSGSHQALSVGRVRQVASYAWLQLKKETGHTVSTLLLRPSREKMSCPILHGIVTALHAESAMKVQSDISQDATMLGPSLHSQERPRSPSLAQTFFGIVGIDWLFKCSSRISNSNSHFCAGPEPAAAGGGTRGGGAGAPAAGRQPGARLAAYLRGRLRQVRGLRS